MKIPAFIDSKAIFNCIFQTTYWLIFLFDKLILSGIFVHDVSFVLNKFFLGLLYLNPLLKFHFFSNKNGRNGVEIL